MELISGLAGGFGLGIIVWELLNRKTLTRVIRNANRALDIATHLLKVNPDADLPDELSTIDHEDSAS